MAKSTTSAPPASKARRSARIKGGQPPPQPRDSDEESQDGTDRVSVAEQRSNGDDERVEDDHNSASDDANADLDAIAAHLDDQDESAPPVDAEKALTKLVAGKTFFKSNDDAAINAKGRLRCIPETEPDDWQASTEGDGTKHLLLDLLRAIIKGGNSKSPKPETLPEISEAEWNKYITRAKGKMKAILLDGDKVTSAGEREARLLLQEMINLHEHGYQKDCFRGKAEQLELTEGKHLGIKFSERFRLVTDKIAESAILAAAVIEGKNHDQMALAPAVLLSKRYREKSNNVRKAPSYRKTVSIREARDPTEAGLSDDTPDPDPDPGRRSKGSAGAQRNRDRTVRASRFSGSVQEALDKLNASIQGRFDALEREVQELRLLVEVGQADGDSQC